MQGRVNEESGLKKRKQQLQLQNGEKREGEKKRRKGEGKRNKQEGRKKKKRKQQLQLQNGEQPKPTPSLPLQNHQNLSGVQVLLPKLLLLWMKFQRRNLGRSLLLQPNLPFLPSMNLLQHLKVK